MSRLNHLSDLEFINHLSTFHLDPLEEELVHRLKKVIESKELDALEHEKQIEIRDRKEQEYLETIEELESALASERE